MILDCSSGSVFVAFTVLVTTAVGVDGVAGATPGDGSGDAIGVGDGEGVAVAVAVRRSCCAVVLRLAAGIVASNTTSTRISLVFFNT